MQLFSILLLRRKLLADFIRRDIRSRYFGTVTGALWALLNPVAQLAVYAFLFGLIFQVRFPQLGETNIVTFIALAMWPWFMFQEGVQRAMSSIPANADLIRKVAFPRALLPVAGVCASFIVHFAGYCLVIIILAVFGEKLQIRGLPVVMLAIVTLFLCAMAFGLVLSALHAVVRDVEHAATPLFALLFYATPILYPLALVPENLRTWIALNPFTPVVGRIRDGWLNGALPNAGDLMMPLFALAAVIIAQAFFNRISPYFEEFA